MEEVKRESDRSVGTIFSGALIHIWCSSESRSTTVCVLKTVKEKQCVSVMFTEQLSSCLVFLCWRPSWQSENKDKSSPPIRTSQIRRCSLVPLRCPGAARDTEQRWWSLPVPCTRRPCCPAAGPRWADTGSVGPAARTVCGSPGRWGSRRSLCTHDPDCWGRRTQPETTQNAG